MNLAIIDYLQVNGEKMETEIAKALQIPMTQIHTHLAQLSVSGEVICCKVTRYIDGKPVEGTSYRLSRARSGKPMAPLKPVLAGHKTR
jgi:predicted ArsR family transcriptional regulator